MSNRSLANPIVVAGHICLDVIPSIHLPDNRHGVGDLFTPGKLVDIGAAKLSTGGAVSNTGLALHRLGEPVRLMGKVGKDLFGDAILQVLRTYNEQLSQGMIVADNENSSYTLVISPPGVDRIFLHCTGANDTFTANDVSDEAIEDAKLFHFGYPPLMRKMYEDEGRHLEQLLSRVKQRGITVSLDLARPDPDSAAGRVDWRTIFERSLPYVDIFLPSFEEILYMLRPALYDELADKHEPAELLHCANSELLSSIADELLSMGVAVAGLKLGEHGFYMKTTADRERLSNLGFCAPSDEIVPSWINRELLAPCFAVRVAGTTGAGDCTIAGFLASLSRGLTLEETMLAAVGVGGCNVEEADAVSGIPHWDDVQQRIQGGWEQQEPGIVLNGFVFDSIHKLWVKR